MKRLLLILLSLAVSHTVSLGQSVKEIKEWKFRELFPYKYEVRVGWGGFAYQDQMNYIPDQAGHTIEYVPYSERDRYSLESMYGEEEGAVYMTHPIMGEFSLHVNRWFTFSTLVAFNGMWGSTYSQLGGQTVSKKRGVSFALVPQARWYWSNKKYFRGYSSFGIGVAAGTYDGQPQCLPAVQFTALGLSFGRKVFAYFEYSAGTVYMGGSLGIGYRF